jgi:hypothetical protein
MGRHQRDHTFGLGFSRSGSQFTWPTQKAAGTLRYVMLSPPKKGSLVPFPTRVPTPEEAQSSVSPEVVYLSAANESGVDDFTYAVCDEAKPVPRCSSSLSVQISTTAVDDAPVLSAPSAIAISEDTNNYSSPAVFTANDVESGAVCADVVKVSSSNPALLPLAQVSILQGASNQCELRVAPLANQFGTAQITLSIAKTGQTTERIVPVTVTSVNDAPTAAVISFWADGPQGEGNAFEDSVITCEFTPGNDVEGDALLHTRQWTVNGVVLPNVNTQTLNGTYFSAQDEVKCQILSSDGPDTTVAQSDPLQVQWSPIAWNCPKSILLPPGTSFSYFCSLTELDGVANTSQIVASRCTGVVATAGRLQGTQPMGACMAKLSVAKGSMVFSQEVEFVPQGFQVNGAVYAIAQHEFSGAVTVGGAFSKAGVTPIGNITSYHPTYPNQKTCNFKSGFNGDVNVIKDLGGGIFLVGGAFSHYHGEAVGSLVKMGCNGELRADFSVGSGFQKGSNPGTVLTLDTRFGSFLSPSSVFWITAYIRAFRLAARFE